MAENGVTAADFLPPPRRRSLTQLAGAAESCEGCELYKGATHVVFGAGRASARLVLVGEQPGDQEDLAGEPFVGPAGRVLDRALAAAAIDRASVYVTNAVKHFYFVERGTRRLHQKPKARHVRSCAPWLRCELEAIKPKVTVAMGATAGQALLGASYRVGASRGKAFHQHEWPGGPIFGAMHPSAILRMRTKEDRDQAMAEFIEDLKTAQALAG